MGPWPIERGRRLDAQVVSRLCLWVVALLVAAHLWQLDVPVSQKLRTPSGVLLTTGLAMLALAAPLPWRPCLGSSKPCCGS